MSYNDNETPFFNKGDLEDRLERYDEIEDEEDTFLASVVAEFTYNVSLWYFARPNSKEQFEELKKGVDKLDEEDEEEKPEEKPEKKPVKKK